jgi:hypothetical protein
MNSFAPVNPKLIDVELPEDSGYSQEVAAGDTRDVLWSVCGDASREFPKALWFERSEWADRANENDKHNTWAVNFCDRFTNQSPNHFCTCHSLGSGFEMCRNRQRGIIFPDGPKKNQRYEESKSSGSVWVSPMSVYAEANPREWGGASIRRVLDICIRRGFLPDSIQPRDYGFKHTLAGTTGKGGLNQSRGSWTPVRRFPEGWEQTAKHFRIQEVIFPESAEQVMCLILAGYSVCVGRKGHAVPYALANVKDNLIGYVDSYDVIRWDSWASVRKSAAGAPYAIASVTTPDDWNQPAGAAA